MFNTFSASTMAFSLIAVASVFPTVANAGEIHLAGSTLGSLNGEPFVASTSVLDLAFASSTFDNDTVGGSLDLGGNANPASNFNNLGSFSLGLTNAVYNGNQFSLQVTFSSPSIVAGGSVTTFNDVITGTVKSGNGGVFVNFDNTPQTFTFANATAKGSFTMFVNDVSIAPGQDASLTAHITGSQEPVPEPASLAILGIGMVGFIKRQIKKA